MPAKLTNRVGHFLRHTGRVRAGDRVAAAVSGGADSVALFHLLLEWREELGITVAVAHFHHQLRGAEADADEHFVAELAGKHGCEFFCERADVRAAAREHGWNLEDAGRRLRYAWFEKIVAEGRAQRVAVAHTADDQAETVLARLLRGTGPAGLSAIYPEKGVVLRPLLEVRRAELRSYLRERGQSWREDESNRDATRLRARIREKLLPLLERDFQPAAVAHMNELAQLSREDEAFWAALLEATLARMAPTNDLSQGVNIRDLLDPLPGVNSEAATALAKRLIRRLALQVKDELGEMGKVHIEQVLELARHGASGQRLELPGGVCVEREFDRLRFTSIPRGRATKETAGREFSYEYSVQLPREGDVSVALPAIGKRLGLKVFDWPAAASDTSMEAQALDRDRLQAPLVVRNWHAGDAYRPAGRRQAHKLKELFLRHRIPARSRRAWPVLTSGGRIAWALGLPVAVEFAAGKGTHTAVCIIEEPQ